MNPQSDLETLATEDIPTVEALTEEMDKATSSHREVIETVISSLEQNDSAMVIHSDDGHLWKFQYGSVEVFVQLTGESDDDLLTIWSAVLSLPAKDEPGLMRKLLKLNWEETYETCFGIFNDQVVVLAQRTIAGLSPGEISRAITLVATIADDHDEALQQEFGAA